MSAILIAVTTGPHTLAWLSDAVTASTTHLCSVLLSPEQGPVVILAKSAKPVKPASLPTVIANLRSWIMGILAAVATLFLVLGGVRYLAAGGDPSEVERAKSALKSALIGYGLAVLAPILLTVLKTILQA